MKSYVEERSSEDVLKLFNFLKISGYYFSNVDLIVKQNDNKTVDLTYDITLNQKAVIKIHVFDNAKGALWGRMVSIYDESKVLIIEAN